MREYTVFNVSQTQNVELPPADDAPTSGVSLNTDWIDRLLDRLPEPPAVSWGCNQALYRPGSDTIEMPPPERFHTDTGLCSVFLHELAHATGHHSRLNRFDNSVQPDRLHDYAAEELVAELSAAMLLAHHGLTPAEQNRNAAAYIAGWRKHLTAHPGHLITAAQQAQKVFDLLTKQPADDPVC